jgi:hypothetical protein
VGLVKYGSQAMADAQARAAAPPAQSLTRQRTAEPAEPNKDPREMGMGKRPSGFWEWIKQAF